MYVGFLREPSLILEFTGGRGSAFRYPHHMNGLFNSAEHSSLQFKNVLLGELCRKPRDDMQSSAHHRLPVLLTAHDVVYQNIKFAATHVKHVQVQDLRGVLLPKPG